METFSGKLSGQREQEITQLIAKFVALGVTCYLEVGTRFGDTFHQVMSALPIGSVGVAVDMPEGNWGRGVSADYMARACEDLRKKGYVIHDIYGDSTDADTIEKVRELGPYDAALIDGDHTIEGITKDWGAYATMCKTVALHDITGRGLKCKITDAVMGVPDLWDKVKTEYAHDEFIEAGKKMGIGVAHDVGC